jgi:tRNA (adenine57-N1/adenine58-N1)-methyltransferase
MRLLLDRKGGKYLVQGGGDLHTKYGMVSAADIDSSKPGDVVKSNTSQEFTVLEPDIIDFIKKAKRGPQAMTLKDMSLITGFAALRSGSRVVEAGTGSGLLSMHLAYVVHPAKLVTYEIREDFADIARGNFKRFGVENVELKVDDVYEGIEESGLDAVVLDLAEPWRVVPNLEGALRIGGRLISYSPSINQSRQLAEVLEDYMHGTFECMLRDWKPLKMSPDTRMLGHTGFLTVARRLK